MRRSFWLAAGFGLGVYAGERVRRTVVQWTPDTVGDRVRGAVADALDAGRAEMRARERRLRETLAAPDRSGRREAPGAGEAPAVGR
ncbi:MAG: hypothetical protein FJW77_13490 [Actinobacteria bacterium]|nr:hypothetical protein [Actinomycetota bacterium]